MGKKNPKFATEYIKGCATFQMPKSNKTPANQPCPTITPEPNALPVQYLLDFIVQTPESSVDTILTITDHDCFEAAIVHPGNERRRSRKCKLYSNLCVPPLRPPHEIISDRTPASPLTSLKLCSAGIKQNISTAFPSPDRRPKREDEFIPGAYLLLYC